MLNKYCILNYNSTSTGITNADGTRALWIAIDIIVFISSIISIIGNTLVVFVYHTTMKTRIQSRKVLTINLAIADIWMALTLLIIATVFSFEETTILENQPASLVIVVVVYTVGHFASFFLLLLLAVDTWKSYHDPLTYNRTVMLKKDVRRMCVLVWIVSVSLLSAFFVGYPSVCVLLIYNTILLFISFTVSCILLSIVCSSLIRRRQQKKQRKVRTINSWPVMCFPHVPFILLVISGLALVSLTVETVSVLLTISSYNIVVGVIAIFMKCVVISLNPFIYWWALRQFRERLTEMFNNVKKYVNGSLTA